MDLKKLFNPKSIAVVGASPEQGKVGHVIMKNLFEFGYEGKIYLVNPKYDDIFSQKCYPRLSEIKEPVDLAVISIPAALVFDEIKKNAGKIKNYVIISAGFSETGTEGKIREVNLKKLAEEQNLNILGPNCLGFIVPGLKLNASFAGGLPQSGGISFISQSGALAVALMDIAAQAGAKFSNIISIGNKMNIGESELLDFLAQDSQTKAIGMYLEGIKDGGSFIRAASKAAKIKPVIILKAGKNSRARKAIASHTGALAGDDSIVSAVFEKTGVLRAGNLEEFFDYFNLMNSLVVPKNDGVVVVTNAGGVGVLASDAFTGKLIRLADIPNRAKKELNKFLPPESSLENPIDILGDARQDRYRKSLDVIGGLDEAGSVICVLTPQDQTPVEEIAEEIIQFKKKTNKLVLAVFLGGKRTEKAIRRLEENGISNFKYPDRAISALDGYCRWRDYKKRNFKKANKAINPKRRTKIIKMIKKAKAEGRDALFFSEAREIMAMYQINTAECVNVEPHAEISGVRLVRADKYPVVLKVDSDKILHKTDKGGIMLGIENGEKLEEALEKMRRNFSQERLIIQPMAPRQTELIIGIKQDDTFGPVVVYGLGGIYTEVFKMVDYLIPPASLSQVEQSLILGKLGFLFQNTRGQKRYPLEEIAKILMGISFLALEIPEIREFDINPLLIYNDKKKPLAVDVKIII